MADESSGLHDISFERLFPWTRLFRGVGVSIDAKKLLLASIGLIAFVLGREAIDRLFSSTSAPMSRFASLLPESSSLEDPRLTVWRLTEPVRVLVGPFLTIFANGIDAKAFLHAVASAAWGVAVWGLVGGAIARIAVVQVARTESIGMGEALRFARRKWLPLIGTPLSPLLGVAFFASLCTLFGLLYWIPGSIGPTLAGAFAVFPLLAGLVMSLVLISLAASWPLMNATVAAEGEDGFDALSRSFAYVNQRPLKYAACVVLAWVLGSLGLFVVEIFARLTIHLAQWALSFGAPDDVLAALYQGATATATAQAAPAARGLHEFWLSVVWLLVHAWVYSYFWTSATIIYLVLRQDVDGTPWHVIAAPERKPFEFAPPTAEATSDVPGLSDTPEPATPTDTATAVVGPDAPAHP